MLEHEEQPVNGVVSRFSVPFFCCLISTSRLSRLGGVVVSVLATGPKGCGLIPGRADGFLRAIKFRSTPSFG
jgi:hypothetical protein